MKKGDEIFISYQEEISNFSLFFIYGFVIEDNPFFKMEISLKLEECHPLYETKLDMIPDLENSFSFTKCLDSEFLSKILPFCRFLAFEGTPTEMVQECLKQNQKLQSTSSISDTDKFSGFLPKCISLQNEQNAWKIIFVIMEGLLKEYPTTVEMDIQMLKTLEMGSNARNCVIVVRDEKLLIAHWIKCAISAEKMLGEMLKDGNREQ